MTTSNQQHAHVLPDSYPLAWPQNFPRCRSRKGGAFKTSLAGALNNVTKSLQLFASDSGKLMEGSVITSNVSLGNQKPDDPGVAVWFVWDGLQVCIPVDLYQKPEANLQAIHHVLESRRTELRHGGIAIVRATFAGFLSLPAPRAARSCWEVLGLPKGSTKVDIKARWRELAQKHHPDRGGDPAKFNELNEAYEAASAEASN